MARKSKYSIIAGVTVQTKEWVVALYLRLSVEDGDDIEYNSIGNQRKICMAYLQEHGDLQFGGVYMDNGSSGMNYKRPGFQAMLADLQAGKINCVIVKDVSRFGRHYILTSEYVERTLPAMGVRLICVNDNYDSEDPNSDRDSLLMPFKLIMNDTYVKDTSKRIRSSIAAKMHGGEYLPSASSVPYGYLRDPEGCTYAIDETAAPVVRRIFEMRANGMGFNTIARALNADGVPSPGKLRFDRGLTKSSKFRDALWIRGTIRKITNDVVYVGSRVHGRIGRDRLGGDKKARGQEEWQVIPHAHPPIVSQKLFDKVQEVNRTELERRSGFEAQAAPESDYREVLRGKVFCGDCGAKMTAGKRISRKDRAKGPRLPNSIFYNCNEYRDSNRQRCSNHYISEELIIEKLENFLNEQVMIFADVEALVDRAHGNGGVPATLRGQLLSLKNRREELETKQFRYLEDLTSGILDRETFGLLKESNRKELAALAEQERVIQAEIESQKAALTTAEAWMAAVRRYQKLPFLDRGLIDALVEKILVFENKSIRICLTYQDPVALLTEEFLDAEGGHCRAG